MMRGPQVGRVADAVEQVADLIVRKGVMQRLLQWRRNLFSHKQRLGTAERVPIEKPEAVMTGRRRASLRSLAQAEHVASLPLPR